MSDAEILHPLPGGSWFTFAQGMAAPAVAAPREVPPAIVAEEAAPAPLPLASSRGRASRIGVLRVLLGGIALDVPAELAEHILPMPALRPMPGTSTGVAGLAEAGGAPVLVLSTGFAAGTEEDGAEEPILLLVLNHEGRRFGLPATRIEAGPEADSAFADWLVSAAARQALDHAPPTVEIAPPVPVPQRHLVLFRAAGMDVALPAEAVVAILPPTTPLPTPRAGLAGVAAHRGAVLPVVDGGLAMGGPSTLEQGPAPLIRLSTRPEVMVAVEQVAGVRMVPAADITPLVQRNGLVQAIARLDGAPLPVMSPHLMGAL
ncbi:chemotaxis protein CheW [Roseococcus pinisoli]|uniref:Chemotaxis protein CheW n=1 Tax=Roseococcus pinisoli TaxID=2835040 RepID=A0ABS5QFK4_9PROT|nr:chemotaxis protein CheW [Roseococcus pinisoli]MBS7812464.1 chemotaxis protein CheW [Roseococcus pinisoli]